MNGNELTQELNRQVGHYGFELDSSTLAALAFLVEEIAPEGRERVADFFQALGDSSCLVAESVRYDEGDEDQ